ncbi:MAG: SCO family protein [Chloroflexales bacterium]|nr:SCO family protein [Chloroflexales bacterium]
MIVQPRKKTTAIAVLRCCGLIVCCVLALAWINPAYAQESSPDPLTDVGFDQRLDTQVPLGLQFVNEDGQSVELRQYFGTKPVILVLGYYECPMLCSIVRDGLVTSLKQVDFDVGKEFEVVYVSIDPQETPMIAAAQKTALLAEYNRPGAEDGWHLLVGNQESIEQLAHTVGFRYVYDEAIDQYAHPSGIVVLTPQGRVARYFYGIEYEPRDLRFGLMDASADKIGAPVDQLLLLCYHYDPATGQYSGIITNVTQLAGIVTVLTIVAAIATLTRRTQPGGTQHLPS